MVGIFADSWDRRKHTGFSGGRSSDDILSNFKFKDPFSKNCVDYLWCLRRIGGWFKPVRTAMILFYALNEHKYSIKLPNIGSK